MQLFSLWLLCASALFGGCATPTDRVKHKAEDAGFDIATVTGDRYEHLVLTGNVADLGTGPIHVYIEGDGRPWIANRWVAKDPTPRVPVALELMQLDPNPSLYLGRPCYFQLRLNCVPEDWTYGRYSEAVVQSMTVALVATLSRLDFSGDIVLIGHSGGGVLAMLLAPRLPRTTTVVTLASNLDTDAWSRLHGYGPLAPSLDPASEAPLAKGIAQIHLTGGKDSNVPLAIVQPVIEKQSTATVLEYPEFDHSCCWTEVWPDVLKRLRL